MTTFPVGPNALAEIYWRLQQATGATIVTPLGITFEEFLNSDQFSSKQSFIIRLDLEKVSHAGFSGEDTGEDDNFFWTSSAWATTWIGQIGATSC